jgi:hypothetical protein
MGGDPENTTCDLAKGRFHAKIEKAVSHWDSVDST